MPLYFGKRFESEHVSGRLVSVQCDKCRCQYFYQLARIGKGAATAPYSIGTSFAARSAAGQSRRDLRDRLSREHELVPCPKCNWINQELIEGYRQGRYRRAGLLAIGVGLIGTISSLLCAWFVSIGPPADRGGIPYFLFGGPAVFVSIGVGIMLLRYWIRIRIQPNLGFPLAPTLPAGSPPAFIENRSTGKLEEVTSREKPLPPVGAWHEFQIGRHELPEVCCDCLKSTSLEHSYDLMVSAAVELKVRYCAECAQRSRRSHLRAWWTTIAIALMSGAGLAVALGLGAAEFWILVGGLSLLSFAFASYVASSVTSPVRIGGRDYSRGIVKLRFRNQEFGVKFSRMANSLSTPDIKPESDVIR